MKLLTMLKALTVWFTTLALNRPQLLSGNKIILFISFFVFLGACSPKIIVPTKPPTTPPIVVKPVDKPIEEKTEIIPKKNETANPKMVISLVLPFNLDNINIATAMLPQIAKANLALDYYLGFKMALDSVAILHTCNFKLQVFDNSDDLKITSLLINKNEIKNSDLIIGPVFPSNLKVFSNFSKSLKIPLVSPLAPSNPNIFNNPFLLTVNSTINQHAFVAAAFIKNTLKPKKVLLIRSGQADEFKYAIPFKKGMDSLAKGLPFTEIGIKAIGYENIAGFLNPTGLNVIVLPATSETFLEAIFKELEKLSITYNIAVMGSPNWEKATFLNIETLQKLNTYVTTSYNVDYDRFEVKTFVKNFRNHNNSEPSEYAFKGFDTGFYLASLMAKEGKNYLQMVGNTTYKGLHNQLTFVKNNQFGYYNSSVTVLKYQNFNLVKQN